MQFAGHHPKYLLLLWLKGNSGMISLETVNRVYREVNPFRKPCSALGGFFPTAQPRQRNQPCAKDHRRRRLRDVDMDVAVRSDHTRARPRTAAGLVDVDRKKGAASVLRKVAGRDEVSYQQTARERDIEDEW